MSFQLGNFALTLINTIFNLFTFLLMLRFALQAARADTMNPINQGILGATDWLIAPVQRSLHPISGRYEYVTVIAAVLVKIIGITLIFKLFEGVYLPFYNLLIAGVAGALNAIISIYYFALIIMVAISWIAPSANHPGAILIYQLTQPILQPLHRVLPSLGGLDFSPIVAFLLITFADNLIVNRLVIMSMIPARVVIGY